MIIQYLKRPFLSSSSVVLALLLLILAFKQSSSQFSLFRYIPAAVFLVQETTEINGFGKEVLWFEIATFCSTKRRRALARLSSYTHRHLLELIRQRCYS